MIVRLVKGGRIYSFTFCINVNETLEKDTEILKIDKIGENEPSSTITEKRGWKPVAPTFRKETEIETLDRSKTVNEKIKAGMKLEIEI